MTLRHDAEADAIYIRLNNRRYAFGEELDPERRIDHAIDGTPIGIELLCVSTGVIVRNLPNHQSISSLLASHGFDVITS